MSELEEQLQASVTRLEARKGEPWRPWEHCQHPCVQHYRCRVVERHGLRWYELNGKPSPLALKLDPQP